MDENPLLAEPTHVNSVELTLRFPRSLHVGEALHLRGFFGREFADEVMLHHHETEGNCVTLIRRCSSKSSTGRHISSALLRGLRW